MGKTATVTSKGQITIPQEVRETFGIVKGDRFEFVPQAGELRLRPLKHTLEDLAGMLHRPDMRRFSIKEMNDAMLDGLASDDARIRAGKVEPVGPER